MGDSSNFSANHLRPDLEAEKEDEADLERERRQQSAERDRLLDRTRNVLDAQVDGWVAALALDPSQAASLKAAVAALIRDAREVEGIAVPGGEELKETLEGILNEEQKGRLEELNARRDEMRHRAVAISKLTEIQSVLMLSPAQEEEVLKAMPAEFSQAAAMSRPGSGPSEAMLAEVAIRMKDREDENAAREIFREVASEAIEKELAALARILTPEQLKSYRFHLEDKNAAWLQDDR